MAATTEHDSDDDVPLLSHIPMDILRLSKTLYTPAEESQESFGRCLTPRKQVFNLLINGFHDKADFSLDRVASRSRFGYVADFAPWFNEADPKHPRAKTWRTRWSNRTTALRVQQTLTALVFVINFTGMVWAWCAFGTINYIGTVYQGDCKKTKQYNTWVHFLINALSTILLGSSNFCMQLLVAPTRRDIDHTHSSGGSLDIGVPSIRNLWKIERSRMVVWLLLGFSSGVLHLLWNSAIFLSLPLDSYPLAVVTSDFLSNNVPWDPSDGDLSQLRLNAPKYEKLDPLDCIERYIDPLSVGKDLVVVTNAPSNEATFNDHSSLLSANQPQWGNSNWDRRILDTTNAILTVSRCVMMLAIASGFLGASIGSMKHAYYNVDLVALWNVGLGKVNSSALSGLHRLDHFLSAVLFANVFQLVVSFLYLMCNSLLTCLLVANEWSGFAQERKCLRVSAPQGIQRSSYYLSLPYRYGLPLMIASSILHWLISQSVFLVQTHGFDPQENRIYTHDRSRVGYSSIGIVFAMSLGGSLLVTLLLIGFQKFPEGPGSMPLVSTNSRAISAACHAPPEDTDARFLPVQWGVTGWDGKVGHCSLTTAMDVAPPIPGHLYA
ncbi:MAG: hypothetical protein M1812_004162 [Candelaria pacifica]|nr:MAG: hypothetical protein M1812_004162 [Candelaria pacifica]